MARALIEIKAETKQYQQAMKQAVAEMKKLTAEHSLAAAQAKLSGSAQDGLRAKVTELTSKIEVQKGIVQTQAKEYDNLKDQLVAQKEKHAELSKKVEEAKKAYEASTQATEENGEETEKLKAEYEKLRGSLAQTETDIKNTESGLGRQETAVIKSKAALAELEVQLKETNAELARAPFDEYAKKAEKVGETVTNAGKALLPLSTGILGIGTAAVKTTADFDSQMSKVSAISGATGEDFDKLREKAREMGSRTKYSASESAEAQPKVKAS